MPELPEVEYARRCLQAWAKGRRLVGVEGLAEVVEDGAHGRTTRAIKSLVKAEARFARFERHGKNLFLGFGESAPALWIWSHLGMTGKWLRRKPDEDAPRFSRATLTLDDGFVLHFCDLRRFGAFEVLTEDELRTRPALASLGPDLLDAKLDGPSFAARFAGRKLAIKPLLLDQTRVAGVGNIQAAEGLFRAALDPRAVPSALGPEGLAHLFEGLRASVAHTLASFDEEAKKGHDVTYVEEAAEANPFLVYGREGAPCPHCGEPIARFVQAGRSTFHCPACQRGGAAAKQGAKRGPKQGAKRGAKRGSEKGKQAEARVSPGARRAHRGPKLPGRRKGK